MTMLAEALKLTPRPFLLFLGRRRGLSYSSNLPKAELLTRLAQTLADEVNSLRFTFYGLSDKKGQSNLNHAKNPPSISKF